MRCPRCNSAHYVKDGIIRKSSAFSEDTKRKAVELYLEGLGFRSIGRFLHLS